MNTFFSVLIFAAIFIILFLFSISGLLNEWLENIENTEDSKNDK